MLTGEMLLMVEGGIQRKNEWWWRWQKEREEEEEKRGSQGGKKKGWVMGWDCYMGYWVQKMGIWVSNMGHLMCMSDDLTLRIKMECHMRCRVLYRIGELALSQPHNQLTGPN